jgi:hypothetical protein
MRVAVIAMLAGCIAYGFAPAEVSGSSPGSRSETYRETWQQGAKGRTRAPLRSRSIQCCSDCTRCKGNTVSFASRLSTRAASRLCSRIARTDSSAPEECPGSRHHHQHAAGGCGLMGSTRQPLTQGAGLPEVDTAGGQGRQGAPVGDVVLRVSAG